MLKHLVKKLVQEELEKRAVSKNGPALPLGYNPLEIIRGGLFQWVKVPFNGVDVWCELRCLNATQIRSCGDYSGIGLSKKDKKEITRKDMIELRNYQENLIRLALNRPTYNQIAELADRNDFLIIEKRKELEELKKTDISALSLSERKSVESRIDDIELFLGFILPEDTFDFLTRWVTGDDVSDIKSITDEQFLEAAILAENGKDNPSDHLSGVFTDHNKSDIDRYAWNVYAKHLQNREIEIKAGRKTRMIGGPK